MVYPKVLFPTNFIILELSCTSPNSRSPHSAALLQTFNEQSLSFQEKLIARSGLGQETYLPDGEGLAQASLGFRV